MQSSLHLFSLNTGCTHGIVLLIIFYTMPSNHNRGRYCSVFTCRSVFLKGISLIFQYYFQNNIENNATKTKIRQRTPITLIYSSHNDYVRNFTLIQKKRRLYYLDFDVYFAPIICIVV